MLIIMSLGLMLDSFMVHWGFNVSGLWLVFDRC